MTRPPARPPSVPARSSPRRSRRGAGGRSPSSGIAILDRLIADRPARSRFVRTWLFGVAWLAPGMGWMWFLTAPGYIVAVAAYSGYLGLAAAIAPGGRWRRLALPAALTVAEAVRFVFPFGGVPLASLGISQAFSPLSQTARLGGVILITWLTFMAGSALSAAWERSWRQAIALAAIPVALIALGTVAPSGHDNGRTLTVALVQGGGPQGTRAVDTDPQVVFDRHLSATRAIDRPVDLVVWPENVIDVNGVAFADSPERAAVAAEASRLAGAHRGRRDRGRRRALHQRPDPGHARRAAGQSLRQGAAGALRRVHAAAGPAEGARGADLPGPPRRAGRGPSPRCSTCRPATGSR